MVDKKERKSLFIRALVSLGIAAVTCIPFTLSKVTVAEIVIKYLVFAVAIAVLTMLGISSKYRYYRPGVKFTTVVTYTPLFSYVAAIMFNTLMLLARFNVYSQLKMNLLLIGISVLLVVVVFLSHVYFKVNVLLSKNESMLADAIFGVLSVVYVVVFACIAGDYSKVISFGKPSVMFIILPILAGLLFAALHYFILQNGYDQNEEYVVCDAESLLEDAPSKVKVVNNTVTKTNTVIKTNTVVKTNTLVNTVKEVVTLKNTEEVEKLNERIVELEKELNDALNVIASSKEKILETLQKCADNDQELILNSLNESYDVINQEHEKVKEEKEKMVAELSAYKQELEAKIKAYEDEVAEKERLQKEAEEKARLDAERRQKEAEEREKMRKPLEPQVSYFVDALDAVIANDENVEKVVKEDGSQYRYTYNGKPFAVIQVTNNDYRFQFTLELNEMQNALLEYSRDLTFERASKYNVSGEEINYVKAVYKGEESFTAEAANALLKRAYETIIMFEENEAKAIEEVKAAKEREKAAYQALKEKEAAERKALKEAEKEQAKKEAENKNDETLVEDEAA